MSPWVALTGEAGSMTSNDDSDIIGTKGLNTLGQQSLYGVPVTKLPYIEASRAPDSWFKAMDTVVE
jgi:hypothetical protein